MSDNSILPKAQSQVVDNTGKPTRAFYDFFRKLANGFQSQLDALTSVVNTLAKVVASLGGDPDGSGIIDVDTALAEKVDKTTSVYGTGSLQGGGNLYGDQYLSLKGDDPANDPVAMSFYGVLNDDAGRAWNLVSSNFAAIDNGDDTYTLDLADVTLTAGGTIKLRAFDVKGRLSQEDDATTTNLTEGTNLYFTDARVRATTLTGLSVADATDVAATDNVLVGIGKLQAQVTANLSALALKLDRVGDSVELAGGSSLKQVDAITTTYLQNAGGLFIGTNIAWDGTNWNRGDTSKAGVTFSQRADTASYEVRIDSGSGNNSVLSGDATGLKILGNVAWHAGNFDPSLKANDSAVMHLTTGDSSHVTSAKYFDGGLVVGAPADFWVYAAPTGGGKSFWGSEGYFGTNGSFAMSFRANGYRNASTTWTSLARGGFAGASGIDMRPTGVLMLGADSAAPTGFDVTWRWQMTTASFQPVTDNVYTVGDASHRPSVIWAGTGTISTSDAREKTAVAPLTATEIAAAGDLARAIGTYQWLSMIAEKGAEAARHHAGLTVQQAIAIMQAHGLDPMRYGFICYDQWEATPEVWEDVPAQLDEDGNETVPASRVLIEPARPAGDRYSFRDTELDHFLVRGAAAERDELKVQVADLAARLDALEGK